MKNFPIFFILVLCLILIACKNREIPGESKKRSGIAHPDTASVNALFWEGVKFLHKDPDSAIVYFERSLQQSTEINYRDGIGYAYDGLGEAYFFKYVYDTAIWLHEKSYDIFEKAGNKNGMAQALFSLSYDHSLTQNMHKSLECARRSRKLFEETGNLMKVYDVTDALVYAYNQFHMDKTVDSLVNDLIVIAEKIGDKERLANSYFNLGTRYVEKAYLNLAIEAFFKALKFAEESGDSTEISNALGSIGLVNLYLKDYDNAIKYYTQQEVILKKMHNEYDLSTAYANLGIANNELRNYQSGLDFHNRALALRNEINYSQAISNSLYHIGYTYYLMEDSADKALNFVNRSLQIDGDIHNYNGIAQNYMLKGKIYILKRNFPEAVRFLEQGLALARQYNFTDVIRETSETLSKLYAGEKAFEKAYANMMLFNEINDSIISGENFKKITQLEMQHTFDKKQNEIEVSHLQEKLQFEAELKRNKMTRNFSLLAGTLIVAFGVFLFLGYRKSRKADKEKEALLKEIHHRVKNNLMVISSLLNLQSGSITDDKTKSAVRESQSRVKSMALIHQLLYQSEMFTSIDFPKYLEQLMASLQSTYHSPGRNIRYVIQADPIRLDIDTAIPLGLITSELATNAYKYAFADSTDGTIEISLHRASDHQCMLCISDNGKGLPRDFDMENTATLGLKLVKILTRQIKAKLSYETKEGAAFKILFTESIY